MFCAMFQAASCRRRTMKIRFQLQASLCGISGVQCEAFLKYFGAIYNMYQWEHLKNKKMKILSEEAVVT